MSQALYRTWRPALWDEVVGQDHIVQTLKNAISMGRIGHAYLFAGPRGTGKTTSARLLAKAANCLDDVPAQRPCNLCENCLAVNEGRFLDLIEIDAASNTSVDDVRELRDKINFAPSQGRYKVYIIDEVHMLSNSAFNALLKTLEEPPTHVIFILATTEIHKIPATVLSRCQRFEFRRIPVPVIVDKLTTLTKQENIVIEPEALSLIARQATGSMRDAISLVDQLSSIRKEVTLALAQDLLGTTTNQAVIDLTAALIDKDQSKGLEIIQNSLDSGADSRQFARQTVEYLRDLLIIKLGVGKQLEITPETRVVMEKHAESFEMTQLTSIIEDFGKAATDLKTNWHPGLGLELAYASAISWAPQVQTLPVAQFIQQATPSYTSPQSSYAPPAPARTAKPTQSSIASDSMSDDLPLPQAGSLELTTENLRAKMGDVKELLKSKNNMAVALLNSAKAYVTDNRTILLNFKSELLCERMNNESNYRHTRIAFAQFFGAQIRLQCTWGQDESQIFNHTSNSNAKETFSETVAREFNGVIINSEENEEEDE